MKICFGDRFFSSTVRNGNRLSTLTELNKYVASLSNIIKDKKQVIDLMTQYKHFATTFQSRKSISPAGLNKLYQSLVPLVDPLQNTEISKSLQYFARMEGKAPLPLLASIQGQLKKKVISFSPRDCSSSFWALGKLRISVEEEVIRSIEDNILKKYQVYESIDIAKSYWAFARLRRIPSCEVLDVLESQLFKLDRSIRTQEISNILWAYGTLGIPPSDEYLKFSEKQICLKILDFKSQEVANSYGH